MEGLTGVFTGLDTNALITKILAAQRGPIKVLQSRKDALGVRSDAFTALKTELATLQTKIASLKTSAFFGSLAATPSDTSVLSATADSTAASTTYSIEIKTLATSTLFKSGTGIGDKIARPPVALAAATGNSGFGTALTTGDFTVNGATITIGAGTIMDDPTDPTSIMEQIRNAPGINGAATTYNETTGVLTITPNGGQTVLLGNGATPSNFLSVAHLYSTGIANGVITSLTPLGSIDPSQALNAAASRAAAGFVSGTISINGASVTVNNTDTLTDVLGNITANTDVYASYDAVDDRIVLTSKSTGSAGITVANGTGTFASVFKLTTGQVTVGSNTTFSINGGSDRVSMDNVISATESGITGLSMTALKANVGSPISLTIAADKQAISDEVQDFVTQYNSFITALASFTTPPSSATKNTDKGSILVGDALAARLPTEFRKLLGASYGTGTLGLLSQMGITGSSGTKKLTFDSTKLSDALGSNAADVETVFTSAMTALDTALTNQVDLSSGEIPGRITSLSARQKNLQTSIDAQEKRYEAQRKALMAQFDALESFQANSSKILSFLNPQKSS